MTLNLAPIPDAADDESKEAGAAFRRGIYPAGANQGVQNTWTWGAAGVRDATGLYHFFVTTWRNHYPMTYPSFLTETHVVHVTAAGPEEVVPAAAGNHVYASHHLHQHWPRAELLTKHKYAL